METIITKDTRTLSGYLVGIGKIHPDGSRDYQEIKPIKNMIVKQGLNNWLRYNGNNAQLITSTSAELTAWPAKNIEYCLFGLSNAANDFATTTELAQLPNINPYNTKKTSWPYCGTRSFDNNGQFLIRISHISPAVTNDYPVKEIGYYTNFTDNSKHLFSRVVLPFTYNLNVGDQLITTYELIINFPYSYSVTPAMQTTLKDANGVDLEAVAKMAIGIANSGRPNFPGINDIGNFQIDYYYQPVAMLPPFFSSAAAQRTALSYMTSVKNFPVNGAYDYNTGSGSNLQYDNGTTRDVSTVSDYIPDTFSRNIVINCPTFWPKMSSETQYTDIYYLNYLGFAVKFGHTVDGVFTPAAWRKYANHTARFVYKQTVATQESIDWLANQ